MKKYFDQPLNLKSYLDINMKKYTKLEKKKKERNNRREK